MDSDVTVNYILFTYNDQQKKLLAKTVDKLLTNKNTKFTAQDRKIFNSLNEEQRTVFYLLIGHAVEEKE